MLISNNRASFHLRWKANLLKHQKVSKYYESGCNFRWVRWRYTCLAHYISSIEIFHFMEIFFKEVKNNCGFIAQRWFMSGTASQFYDAFALVNEVSPIQLICTWHVGKAWRDELRQKVLSIEIQSEVYRCLRIILE